MKLHTLLKHMESISNIEVYTSDQDEEDPVYSGVAMDTPMWLLDYTIGIIENGKISKEDAISLYNHTNAFAISPAKIINEPTLQINAIAPSILEGLCPSKKKEELNDNNN